MSKEYKVVWIQKPTLNKTGKRSWVVNNRGWCILSIKAYACAYCVDYEIYTGFKTDLASVPRILRWLIPVEGKHKYAALLHDYLYREIVSNGGMPRKEADDIFMAAMKSDGVSAAKRYTIYFAVRLFGGFTINWRNMV